MSLNIYVPRDERFGHIKMSDFLAYALKALVQFLLPEFEALCDSTPNEFDSFQDVFDLYEGFKVPDGPLLDKIKENIPLEMLKELVRTDGKGLFKFPTPQVIKGIAYIQLLGIFEAMLLSLLFVQLKIVLSCWSRG